MPLAMFAYDDCDDYHLEYDDGVDDHLGYDDCDDDHIDNQSQTDCGTIRGVASPSQTLLVPPTLVPGKY